MAEEWLRRGWQVVATERSRSDKLSTLGDRYPGRLTVETTDINDAASIRALDERLADRRLDVLFINAGIAPRHQGEPGDRKRGRLLGHDVDQRLLAGAGGGDVAWPRPAGGTIAIMTSELGSIANASGGWQLYSSSKAALNMLMKGYAAKNADDGHTLLLVAPGWVRTEMGGGDATLSVEESIPLVVDMIEANRGRPGLRYVDRFDETLPW